MAFESTKPCTVDGCPTGLYAKGLCKKHYARKTKGLPLDVELLDPVYRYEAKVDRSAGLDACHPWTGATDRKGYGRFILGGQGIYAHRFGYEQYVGPLSGPMELVRHTCDNPPCQNSRHWLTGSHQDNSDDMVERKRHRVGSRHHAAKLTEADVVEIRRSWAENSRRGRQTELAEQYGVSIMVIHLVVHGRIWKHVKIDEVS